MTSHVARILLALALAVLNGNQADARSCRAPVVPGELASQRAIRCAEEFVARNGYTAEPPSQNPADIAHELIVRDTTVQDELRRRRNTLESRAYGICTGTSRDSTGFTVVFRYRVPTIGAARAVSMDSAFARMRVDHQDFRLGVVTEGLYGCAPRAPR